MQNIWNFLVANPWGLPNWAWVLFFLFIGLAILISYIQKKQLERWEKSHTSKGFSGYDAKTRHRPALEVMQAEKAEKSAERARRQDLIAAHGAVKAANIRAREKNEEAHKGSKSWEHFHPKNEPKPKPRPNPRPGPRSDSRKG